MPPLSALVVGSISRDYRVGEPESEGEPGGVVFYAGTALSRMGANTRVVTRLQAGDREALLSPLRAEGIDVLALESRATTSYRNDYASTIDRHVLLSVSDALAPEDVPAAWREADIVHFGPLHPRDLVPELIPTFRGLKGIDLQGLVRCVEPKGAPLRRSEALDDFIAGVDVVQSSEAELPIALDGESLSDFIRNYGISEMLVTRGARGAEIFCNGKRLTVPAPTVSVRSPIGAGDVFLAAYLFLRASQCAPESAARGAAQACAVKIETGQVPENFFRHLQA